MHTHMTHNEYDALCLQIDQLRSQLEDAALSAPPEETLALSQELDALLNRLMLSPSHLLRCSHLFAPRDPHAYGVRAGIPHASMRRSARILPFHRDA